MLVRNLARAFQEAVEAVNLLKRRLSVLTIKDDTVGFRIAHRDRQNYDIIVITVQG